MHSSKTMALQERTGNDQEYVASRTNRVAKALGWLGAGASLVGAGWLGLHHLDSKPSCGETVQLDGGTPEAYMDVEGVRYGINTLRFGRKAVAFSEGATYPEVQSHEPTFISLKLDKAGDYSGSAYLEPSKVTIHVAADPTLASLETSCTPN